MRATLIKKSTQDIVKKGSYPRIDISPITGLEPDLEWLLDVEYPRPIYNKETQKLNKVEAITNTPHPAYNFLNIYSITYEVIELNTSELSKREKDKNVEKAHLNNNIILNARSVDGLRDLGIVIDENDKLSVILINETEPTTIL